MKFRKTFDTATITQLLRYEDVSGLGRIFLYAFVNDLLFMRKPFPFDCKSAQIFENYCLSGIEGDVSVIDLFIVDKSGNHLVIENNVTGDGQPSQLQHFCEHVRGNTKFNPDNYRLVFLTINGEQPKEDTQVVCEYVSYRKDILSWLATCSQYAWRYPQLKKEIIRYKRFIKRRVRFQNHLMQ